MQQSCAQRPGRHCACALQVTSCAGSCAGRLLMHAHSSIWVSRTQPYHNTADTHPAQQLHTTLAWYTLLGLCQVAKL